MDRRCTLIAWLGIGCLLAVTNEATRTNRKQLFLSSDERIVDRMLRTMDESVSPCVDFHKYSSGRYGQGFDVKPQYYFPIALEEQINPKFRDMFEKLKDGSYERGSMEEKVIRLYNSCEAARKENRTTNIFLDVVPPNVNLSWPSYMPEGSKWPKERFHWLVTLARLGHYGLRNVLFRMSLRVDSEDRHSYVYVIEGATHFWAEDFISYDIDDKFRDWGLNGTQLRKFQSELFSLGGRPKKIRLSLQELETEYGVRLIDYFKIVVDQKFDPNTQVEVDVDYMVLLDRWLSSYDDQEMVANYLMERFGTFMTSYEKSSEYQCVVAVRTSMEAACELLYEEHVLNHSKEYESQIQRVFEAVRKQFSQRVEANRLNLSTSYISYLRKKLSTTTINVGILPKEGKYLYDKLHFDIDDDFATMQLKAMSVLTKSKALFMDKLKRPDPIIDHLGFPIEFGEGRTIFLPHDLLVEPFFMPESHEVFKVSMQGYIIARLLLAAIQFEYANIDIRHYKEFISLLDDKHVYFDRVLCFSKDQINAINYWGLHLVLLNIVHDAYFSKGSGFSQVQPDFTSKSLKELFFLNIAQNIVGTKMLWSGIHASPTYSFDMETTYNPVFRIATYAETFHCPIISSTAVNCTE